MLVNVLLYVFPYFAKNDFWIMTFMWTLQANETHVWLHCKPDQTSYLVGNYCKRGRLLMTPESHRRHHRDLHDRYFCTLNGWANFVVNIFANIMFRIKSHINKKIKILQE